MIDLKPLFDLSFWFTLQPELLSPFFEKGFFFAFSAFVIFGAIIRIVAKQKKYDKYMRQTFSKIGTMLQVMGIAGLAWFFFAFETIYIIGARFWFLLWVVGFIVWTVQIIRFVKVQIPEMKKEEQSKASANKYLPRKKRK